MDATPADRIRAGHQEIIAQQDEGLEQLSKALRNQQKMGRDMQDEVQEHNGWLGLRLGLFVFSFSACLF